MARPPITMWLPLLAVLFVAIVGGGLGVIFIVLRATVGDGMAERWGDRWHDAPVIILGMAIVVLVPLVAGVIHTFDLKFTRRPGAWEE